MSKKSKYFTLNIKGMPLRCKIYTIVFFSIVFYNNTKAQLQEFDLLRNKIEELNKLLPDSAIKLIPLLQKKANSNLTDETLAKLLQTEADVKASNSFYIEAKTLNDSSYLINKKIGNKKEILKNITLYGSIYQKQGEYVNGTKYFLEVVDLAKDLKEYSSLKYAYRALSKISLNHKKQKEAFAYAKQSIAFENISPNARDEGLGYIAIADYYVYNNIDSANKYYQIAYNIFDKNKIDYSKAWALSLWAIIFAEKDIIKTGEMAIEAQRIFDTIAPKDIFSANNIGNIGEIFFIIAQNDSLIKKVKGKNFPQTKQQLLDESEKYSTKSIQYSIASKNALQALYFTGNLANLQAYKGDYKSAYKNLQAKITLSDSLYSQKNKNTIAKLEAEKDVLKLTSEKNQKSLLNKILIGTVIALSLIGFLAYRNFSNKQKLQQTQITQLEKDKQLLAVDAMLKGQEEERKRLAKDLHDGLGGMLSGVKLSFVNMKENMIMDAANVQSFEASILQLDNSIAELRKVAHNLMPEALVKFGLKNAILDFCNSIQLSSKTKIIFEQMGGDRDLGNTPDLYIYRIIQELVNNAIKHAQPNQILVQLTKAQKTILIAVENDGNYFDTESIKNAKGIGMRSVQQRVDYFTGKIDISSDKVNGTSVNIELNA